MFLAKFLFLVALWLSLINLGYAESGEVSGDVMPSPTACLNCSLCQYPCHPLPPPPPSPPPLSGYPSYGEPPPPAQGNCPPTPVGQCCQFPPPTPYGYMPFYNHSASTPLPFTFFSLMILLFSFAVLF